MLFRYILGLVISHHCRTTTMAYKRQGGTGLKKKMKLTIVLSVCAFVAVAHGNICWNNDPSACTHTCPDGERKACEHDVCTCAKSCTLASDCGQCPSVTDPHTGHIVMQERAHCFDSACICLPEHMGPQPGGEHGGAPGGR